MHYSLPVNPSPNLRNMESVYLYPSLGLFEGTVINVGRGTEFPFQVFGSPEFSDTMFSYTPMAINGRSNNILHEGEKCYGMDLRSLSIEKLSATTGINLEYLIFAYQHYPDKGKFFNSYFENLAGTASLRDQIIQGYTAEQIRQTWQPDLQNFFELRKKYIKYPDFEK